MSKRTIHIETPYYQGDAVVVFGEYGNGRTAMQLESVDGEPLYTATVNVPDSLLMDGCVFLKGWSANEGVPEALAKAGVVAMNNVSVPVGGFGCNAEEAKLLWSVEDPA